jgi:hypothetical protein
MLNKNEKITEIMNLIGYGLAKFDNDFIQEFDQPSKAAFARYIVELGLANTTKAVSNRMDSFDPYFENGRRGWFQRNQREHIKLFIDSLFGNEDAHGFANVVKMYIHEIDSNVTLTTKQISPAMRSKFKQLQETGMEAEFFFMNNYQSIPIFDGGILEDARLWGDGYDFQIQCSNSYLLAEVKGLRESNGAIRMTQNEYNKALEYANDYVLVVVSNLLSTPKLTYVENPVKELVLTPREQHTSQISYYSKQLSW